MHIVLENVCVCVCVAGGKTTSIFTSKQNHNHTSQSWNYNGGAVHEHIFNQEKILFRKQAGGFSPAPSSSDATCLQLNQCNLPLKTRVALILIMCFLNICWIAQIFQLSSIISWSLSHRRENNKGLLLHVKRKKSNVKNNGFMKTLKSAYIVMNDVCSVQKEGVKGPLPNQKIKTCYNHSKLPEISIWTTRQTK